MTEDDTPMVRFTYKLLLWMVIAVAPGGLLLLPVALGRPKARGPAPESDRA